MTYQEASGDSSRVREGCLPCKQCLGRLRRVGATMHEGDDIAAARQSGVERRDVVQRQADAAERHGQRRQALVGEGRLDADFAETAGELAGTDGGQHFHGRDVERLGERVADRYGAVEVLVEVLRRVAAEAHGAILDERFGMRQARLEGEAVDKGLQRGAGRAHGVDHVDGAEAGVVEIAGRADVGDHLAGGVVDGEDGSGQLLAEQLGLLLGKALERLLHRAVDGQPMNGLLRVGRHLGFGEVRRQLGECTPADRHRLVRGAFAPPPP